MPAVSKKQQRFFGMVRAAQKGEGSASPEVAKVASEISKDDAKKFAKTKHKGLPMKKEAMTHQEALDAGWEMTGEGIWMPPQEVTELSKRTLGNYVKDASSDAAMTSMTHGNKPLAKDAPKREKKILKRLGGIRKATDKLSKEEVVHEGDVHSGQGEKIQKRTKKWMDKKGMKGAPGLDAMKARTAEHEAKRGVKEELTFEGWKDKAGDAIKKALKKKDAPKHDYGKDAGAEARKKLKDKEHNKYVSFLDAPDD